MNRLLAEGVYRLAAVARKEATFRYFNEYQQSQFWSAAEQESFRHQSLTSLFAALSETIPYYRGLAIECLSDAPIVEKSDLQENIERFCAPHPMGPLTKKTTGGSTGQAVTITKDNEAMAREQAATMRGYTWAGIQPGDKQARLWGVPPNRIGKSRERIRDALLNRIRFSAFNYTEGDLHDFYRHFLSFKPRYLYGYVSIIRDFARFLEATAPRKTYPWLTAVITTSEVLTQPIRTEIQASLGVRVWNEYGCGEVGTIAHECEEGSMHIHSENLIVEIVDDTGQPTTGDGHILVTELHNRAQPLVRYRVGDFGRMTSKECPCGKTLPVLTNIHGRAYDIILGPEGRKYHPEFFIYIFEDLKRQGESVQQFQVVQMGKTLEIRVVPGELYNSETDAFIRRRLEKEFGNYFEIRFKIVSTIEREPSGKLRVVKRLQDE